MKRNLILAVAILMAASTATAQTTAPTSAAAASSDYAEGEVRKVDKASGKITLRHGEIKSLDMPPMTMVFTAARPGMLDQVKAGDKVRFRAANDGGTYTVIEIQPAR